MMIAPPGRARAGDHPDTTEFGIGGRITRAPLIALAVMALAAPTLAAEDARLELGRKIFSARAEPQCAICHTLADARSAGKVGPNLDELKPDEDRVRKAVIAGIGVMPAFEETLTPGEIAAVAYYVATVAGQGK